MESKHLAIRSFVFALVAALALAAAFMIASASMASPAFADESSSSASASASAAASDSAAESSKQSKEADESPRGGLPMMGNDYVWFGRELNINEGSVDNDLIAAGQVVDIKNCTAMGDFRIAAQDILIKDSSAFENITVGAENVNIIDSSANAIVAAGKTVSFSGTCREFSAYAETVFIDGTVIGDVVVGANTVEVGTNARILGTLYVSASQDPVMQRGAEVGDVQFKKSESASPSEIQSEATGFITSFRIMLAIMGAIGTLIVAVVAEWLFRRQTAGAAEMIRTRTGAHIGTGIVAALIAPIAVIVLICLGITLPIAGAVAFALLAMTAIAGGFAGASIFKLAFPKLGRYKCALAGGAIIGVASVIPVLGSIVSVAAFMYLLGYVLQSIYLGMREPVPEVSPLRSDFTVSSVAPGAPVAPAGSVAPEAPVASVMPEAPVVSVPPEAPVTSVASVAPEAPVTAATPEAPEASTPEAPVPPTTE